MMGSDEQKDLFKHNKPYGHYEPLALYSADNLFCLILWRLWWLPGCPGRRVPRDQRKPCHAHGHHGYPSPR
ncbi:unnamed protein product [Caenorhabditis nigoni]